MTRVGAHPCFFNSFRINFNAAPAFRLDCTRKSRTSPSLSTARHREWRDTVLMAPRERIDIAFVADNPGDWMCHCHILEHMAGAMMAVVRVT